MLSQFVLIEFSLRLPRGKLRQQGKNLGTRIATLKIRHLVFFFEMTVSNQWDESSYLITDQMRSEI